MTAAPVTIVIADDHRIVREGLRRLLDGAPGLKVVGEADNGLDVVTRALELSPTVVIMDITMPRLSGIEAAKRILAERPGTRVIALSMHAERRYILECLRAGMQGYLLKESAFEELRRALDMVMDGGIYLSSQVATGFIRDAVDRVSEDDGSVFQVLSERERQVLQLLAEGRSTKEIASDLGVSVKTIETHRKKIMEKVDLHSVAELTRYALREGLIEP